MSLDYAMIMNIERRKDKYLSIRDKLLAAGFRDEHIIRHIAKDGQDYDSIKAVNAAACADGFKYLQGMDRC